ncbi:increased DNA methylation 3 [Malus sylvestris]|uniref:increased DNA methylation 3 n=1 Tax=Malus sylvestris TaxID=3752 RepID=UPI0021AD409F|nr:increased DNA methylation 3 [Malus sylvestris]XP_050151668.1 increased DNA methylation 3 [Malus sylvestris]
MDLEPKDDPRKASLKPSFADQHFLVNFIMGNYLGPDVNIDNLKYSAFQRIVESSPPYMSSDLGPSYVSVSLLESLYYYLLRNAHPSLILRPDMLHKYFKGNLTLPSSGVTKESWRQFTDLFPLALHEQIWYPESFRVVKGIVLIDDPVTSFMEEDVLEKFKSLSVIDGLKIDIGQTIRYQHEYLNGGESKSNGLNDDGKETKTENMSNGNGNSSERFLKKYKRRCVSHSPAKPASPQVDSESKHYNKDGASWMSNPDGPALMPLISLPNMEEPTSDSSIVLSGTARKGVVGPPVGLVDIGVSKVAYYFRVALPGVRKDFCQFSCEIESNGKVHLQGITSGGNPIRKRSRVFQMKLQQLCPAGPFTLSFSLPGPVDPRLFAPHFGSDGIFEGVIVKDE